MSRLIAPLLTLTMALAPQVARADSPLQDLVDLVLNSLAGPPSLEKVWTFSSGVGEGGAEIVAYDEKSARVFVTNAATDRVDVVDVRDGTKLGELDPGGSPNSVDIHKGLVAVAAEGATPQDQGHVAFFDAKTLALLKTVPAGALPDMVKFTPDGKTVLVANEGEPNDAYTIDPEGSISVIDVSKGAAQATVQTAGFGAFNGQKAALIASGVRIYGPETTVDEPDDIATVAQDLEPEYIAVSEDSRVAFVTCQEANAIAVVDVRAARVLSIQPLGFKDHSLTGNGLDASNSDGAIRIQPWPVLGMYQPDALEAFSRFGQTFIIGANEGDSRDWSGFSEVRRVRDLVLDPTAFPTAATLQATANLGRLTVTSTLGNADGDADFDQLYSYGARSFSIWSVDGAGHLSQIFDSGDDLEQITAAEFPADFNSTNNANNSFDSRSDDKGPEPEAVVVGKVLGGTYAFIGLERIGGVMLYDITNPFSPEFVEYVNNRDFSASTAGAGDLGPECVEFIDIGRSPLQTAAILVANEISGTTTAYSVKREIGLGDLPAHILDGLIPDLF